MKLSTICTSGLVAAQGALKAEELARAALGFKKWGRQIFRPVRRA